MWLYTVSREIHNAEFFFVFYGSGCKNEFTMLMIKVNEMKDFNTIWDNVDKDDSGCIEQHEYETFHSVGDDDYTLFEDLKSNKTMLLKE